METHSYVIMWKTMILIHTYLASTETALKSGGVTVAKLMFTIQLCMFILLVKWGGLEPPLPPYFSALDTAMYLVPLNCH